MVALGMGKHELTHEVIFIGLPGPTHHYGGLSADNVASSSNRGTISSPKQAALQVLALVRRLRGLGVNTAILPPQLRPHMALLPMGIAAAPLALLEQASSSSAMWVANAATVTPSCDSADGLLHLTTANLLTNPHRRIEAEDTYRTLSAIFSHVPNAVVHPPVANPDEGAANHMRLGGLHVFVYGEAGRQSLAASQEIAKSHGLSPQQTLFIEQNPEVIRAGVFHNDVIAVSHETLLLVHEKAYVGGIKAIEEAAPNAKIITVAERELSVEEAVKTYFFNSQIVNTKNGMAVIAPAELETLYGGKAAKLMRKYFNQVHFLDLHQSMKNGGGPACLRLRVPMLESQLAGLVLADDAQLAALENLIEKYYPETLTPEGLREPQLYEHCKMLLEELLPLLGISSPSPSGRGPG